LYKPNATIKREQLNISIARFNNDGFTSKIIEN